MALKGHRNNLCVEFCLCLCDHIASIYKLPRQALLEVTGLTSSSVCPCQQHEDMQEETGWNRSERFGTAGLIRAFSPRAGTTAPLGSLPGGAFLCPGKPMKGHLFFSLTRRDADLDFVQSHTVPFSSLRASSHCASAQRWSGNTVLSEYKVVYKNRQHKVGFSVCFMLVITDSSSCSVT